MIYLSPRDRWHIWGFRTHGLSSAHQYIRENGCKALDSPSSCGTRQDNLILVSGSRVKQAETKYSATIAVITVNYGTANLAVQAVASALSQKVPDHNIEVHLVDNASPDGDAAEFQRVHKIQKWGKRVTLYREQENHGFGRGNNVVLNALAARETPPEYVILLNPDAILQQGALAAMAAFMRENAKAGCVGAQISKPDVGPVSAAFRFPTALVEFVSAASFGPITRASGDRTLWMAPDIDTQQVDWVAGAAVMFRMQALQEVGFFDPDFFLYFEEVELMWRLAQADWPCWYLREAQVVHVEGAATDVRSGEGARKRRPAYWYQSQAMYFQKTASKPAAAGRAIARLSGAALQLVMSLLRRRPSDLPTHYFRDYARHTLAPVMGFASWPPRPLIAPTNQSQAQHDIDTDAVRSDAINNGQHNRNPAGIGFWALIGEDFRTHERDFFAQGFWALFWHRVGNKRMSVRSRLLRLPLTLLYRFGAKATQWFCGMDLPYTVVVGRRVKLEHFGGMILIARAIGDDVVIRQNTTFGIASPDMPNARPTIGDGVDIGAGSILIGDIVIGQNTIIAAKAAVARDFPADVVVGGVPARVIKQRGEKAD